MSSAPSIDGTSKTSMANWSALQRASTHSNSCGGLLKASRGLHDDFVTGGVAERVVDQLETIDVDQHDREALSLASANLTKRAVELVHEVAAVRQTGERVVIARMLEALLQVLALLDFERQLALGRLQLTPRERQRIARSMQTVHEIVSRKREQPRDDCQQAQWRRPARVPDTSRPWGAGRAAHSRSAASAQSLRASECD